MNTQVFSDSERQTAQGQAHDPLVDSMRRAPYLLASVALLALLLFGGYARAASGPVIAAIKTNNIKALEGLSNSAKTAQEKSLATGVLMALRHQDAKAITVLTSITHSTAKPAVRAAAYLTLSNIFLRTQRYRTCYSAIRTALQLSAQSVDQDYRQTMVFAQALQHINTMRVVYERPGSLPVTDINENVIRVPITIDGHHGGGMLDTGANFSAISTSVAKRFGLQMFSQFVGVNSSTKRAVQTRLGMARRLQVGNVVFKNVPFIVVPDAALRIPQRLRISAIIGLPVLMALGRLELANSAVPTLRYETPNSKSSGVSGSRSNMFLDGLEPLVMVSYRGAKGPLLMELDTGSNVTYFTHNVISDAPKLFAHAKRHSWHVGGAGAVVTERSALRVPQVTLTIAGQHITLKNVVVSSHASSTTDGVIGSDIFRKGSRWMMDFKAMTFTESN